ncbi:beta-eliminating lyase-related protein [Blastopirellula sp. JC732]|uniref:Beta-eliminating lyase-related protein n=1 Tax=Blastopirellula sediminis TaxID=2894196 RepID=A0A9X1SJE9_9BACT|nr:GntG family PLP-dependent aldolase [Blastopirellula sediminis]MCC9604830.1 beta-eliminating lyase-related protein [Blastopirellula sediminis]MCC9631871.1 beta-eliminating lyase-related protein [Blastopirellula sediminis]
MIDLRSDTVTQPTPTMRTAMANAEVGDAVIDIDPTVDRLERMTAELLGKEAAVYMPSGSMTNQIAIRIHCKPGDEFICEVGCHVYNYEQAAFAQLSGIATRTIEGEYGVLKPEQLNNGLIRPENDHMVRTRLVCLENTHNRGAGKIQPYENVEKICRWAHDAGLITHLDGARLFNAVAATGISLADWSQHFDTVSVCFSKGLGAPVGSCLAGPADMMREARRHRKLFGGGMRQAGVIAAGALYGLQHHRERLVYDHEHAQVLAAAIRESAHLSLTPETVDTNIVIFQVDPKIGTAAQFVSQLKEAGVAMMAISGQGVRAVTHLDVARPQIEEAGQILKKLGS